MNNSGITCKLCLESCDNIKVEEDILKEMLDVLKIDLAVNEKFIICAKCIEDLEKYFKFKLTCLNKQNYIQSFIKHQDKKLNLKDIYSNKIENVIISDDYIICRFCMDLLKISSSISLLNNKEGTILKKMIEKCLPELDLNITEQPALCWSCHVSLQNYFSFIMNLENLEEKVRKYCIATGINDEDRVKLNHILKFTLNDWCEQDDNKLDRFKINNVVCDQRDMKVDYKHQIFMEEQTSENVLHFTPTDINILKSEKDNKFDIVMKIKAEEMAYEERKEEENYKGVVCKEIYDQKFLSCNNEDVKIKTEQQEFDSFQHIILPQPEVASSCPASCFDNSKDVECGIQVQTKLPGEEHLCDNKNSSEIVFKCKHCSYQTKRKRSLSLHMVRHKSPSEITMIKCESCPYQTKRRTNLLQHILIHKSSSEITMFTCESCPYEAKLKCNLEKHMLIHKNPSEITMFKCDSCSYETKQKCNLDKHMLIHKTPSEITMFKCESCSYQTKRKYCLQNHVLLHKNVSEITLFKCESCPYQTKFKHNLKSHMLTHKDPSEISMFQCVYCSYQTKRKCSLKIHMLTHKR